MNDSAVFIGTLKDPQISAVYDEITNMGVDVCLIDHENPNDLYIDYQNKSPTVIVNDKAICPKFVWYRVKLSLNPLNTKDFSNVDEHRTLFARASEWRTFLSAIRYFLNCPIVNDPEAVIKFNHKIQQASIAAISGFQVPECIVATSKSKAISFAENFDSIIIKPLSQLTLPSINNPSSTRCVMTMKTTVNHLTDLSPESFSAAPLLMQKYVEKKHELRVVVVGTAIFAFKICSQDKEYAAVDWRHGSMTLDFELIELDVQVKVKIRKFMELTGFFTGSLDFIVTPEDDLVFLECNPSGQWVWLDQKIDGNIARSFANEFVRYFEMKG